MSIDLTTGCTRDERGHNFNCYKICQWCNRPKDEIELEKLRGLLRWRKWPDEKPTDEANFLVVDKHGLFSVKYWYDDDAWLWSELLENGSCWRPIGPLPGSK
jgi:hypothetical protein